MARDQTVLRNYRRWRDTLNDFGWLDNITTGASDIDQVIERRGWVLFFEGKPVIRNEETGVRELRIGTGQHRMFRTLGAPYNQQVWVIGSESGKLTDGPLRVLRYDGSIQPPDTSRKIWLGGFEIWHVVFKVTDLAMMDLAGLRDHVANWWEWCGDNPTIPGGDL